MSVNLIILYYFSVQSLLVFLVTLPNSNDAWKLLSNSSSFEANMTDLYIGLKVKLTKTIHQINLMLHTPLYGIENSYLLKYTFKI